MAYSSTRRIHVAPRHKVATCRVHSVGSARAALVDTTIRLLSQEPLAGRVPTAELLALAEMLDGAGFACLEVSGGGVFDSAVRRGVESPWERIRALKARTTTPLGLALRGRFLVGSRPVGVDFVRRFVASAAESGIDVFRLHDPLNDVSNLREAGEAIVGAGKEFHAGPRLQPGRRGRGHARRAGARAARARRRRACSSTTRPAALEPHQARRARRPRQGGERAARRPLLPGRRRQRARRRDRGGARRRRPDRLRRLPARAHRSTASPASRSRRRSTGIGIDTGVDVDALWERSDLVDEHIGDEPVTPLAPRIAVRAAEHDLPAGLVAALDTHLRAHAAGDRLDEVLDELQRDPPRGRLAAARRADRPDPRLAGADPRALRAAATGPSSTSSARSWRGASARRPAPVDATVAARRRARSPTAMPLDEDAADRRGRLREEAEGLAASEEELSCSRSSARRPSRCCARSAARATRRGLAARRRSSRARAAADPRARPHRPGERRRGGRRSRTSGMRVTVRRSRGARPRSTLARRPLAEDEPASCRFSPAAAGAASIRVESPMVGVFYRAPEPGHAAVRRGRRRRRARPDALHPRGDEAVERGEGRRRRPRDRDPRRERQAGRVRAAPVRARADRRPPLDAL